MKRAQMFYGGLLFSFHISARIFCFCLAMTRLGSYLSRAQNLNNARLRSASMSLEVELNGLTFKNPVMVGSAGYTADENGLKRFIKSGYSAVVTKSTSKEALAGAPPPRTFWYDPYRKSWIDGAEAHRNPGIEKMVEYVKACKDLADKENCHIIGSLSFNSTEEAAYVATKFEEAGVSAIELDMLCSHVGPHLGADFETRGVYWADPKHPERTMQLLKAVKGVVDIPVWVKVRTSMPLWYESIKKESNAEVDGYSFIGPRIPALAIDMDTGKPIFSGNVLLKIKKNIKFSPFTVGSPYSTILAQAILRNLTQKTLIPGGCLARGFDIIQVMMAGADAVQTCTAVYRDFQVVESMLREMRWFMSKKGYSSIREIVGITVEHMPFGLMDIPASIRGE